MYKTYFRELYLAYTYRYFLTDYLCESQPKIMRPKREFKLGTLLPFNTIPNQH